MTREGLDPKAALGPFIADDYQPRLVGIQIDLSSGKGDLTVELRDVNGEAVWESTGKVSSRALRQVFPIDGLNQEVFELAWAFEEGGYGSVDRVINAVESVGVDWEGAVHHNHLQSAWSLALQALGAGRALSAGDYLPYREAAANEVIAPGLAVMMPGAAQPGGGR